MLRESKGNMYEFVTHTWNPIKGKCMHDCCYCYMKRFKQNDLRLDEKELMTDLGENNFIFIGSSTDMFAENVPDEWIERILDKCKQHQNRYLFQSKNVGRLAEFWMLLPKNSILATTIETNRSYPLGKAMPVYQRALWLNRLGEFFETMVTIEPIFDFDLEPLVKLIKEANPNWVNIGADSNFKREYPIPEPSQEKVMNLISELEKFTEVRKKRNLRRLLKS